MSQNTAISTQDTGIAATPPTSNKPERQLSGLEKAATLLISLGTEAAAQVLKNMRDDEVERISIQIASLRNIASDTVEAVLVEYRELAMAQEYVAQGGISFAKDILESALGPRRAEEIMMKVEAAMEVSAFHLLQTVETSQLLNFLENEHPQTAALILAHLNPRKAAEIISGLPPQLQEEIVYRLATMGKTSPQLLRDIEDVIRSQIGSVFGAELKVAGGVEKVAEILNSTSRSAEKVIMDAIRMRDPELATAIKNLMFVFDDLVHLTDRDIQRILTEVEQRDLALAMKAISEELKAKILRNMSARAAAMIQEEIDLMGPVKVRDVEEAQQRIIEVVHRLDEQEEISLSLSSDEVML